MSKTDRKNCLKTFKKTEIDNYKFNFGIKIQAINNPETEPSR